MHPKTHIAKLSTGEKLSTARSKKSGMKREVSPCTPYKRKARGKETSPGFFEPVSSPRGRARGGVSRYRLAGAAAEELIEILGARPTESNRRLWAYYCYHHDIGIIFEMAYQCASEQRQGELKNPVTAFQRRLTRTYGKEAK